MFFSFQWADDVKTWIGDVLDEVEEQINEHCNSLDLPEINLLYANPLQRVIIGLNLQKMLQYVQNDSTFDKPLRLLIQGTAGTGKTFVIKAISYIARRLGRRNGSVLNLAPTGSAANLLPDGRTVHSTTPIVNKMKSKCAQLSDYPMASKTLKKLRKIIGCTDSQDDHQLLCLNMDERSMFSNRLLAWCSQRFCEATNNFDSCFGSIPIVNFFADLGQLGPIGAKDLHVKPGINSTPDELAGYAIYRNFEECVLLNQTMRQSTSEKRLLERLLRIRSGSITQQDWIDINSRYEGNLSVEEKMKFQNQQLTITLHETWAEVNKENRKCLSQLNVPVAVIPSIGRGRHHKQGDKQLGQIVPCSILAVGCKVILTKNQGPLTQFGLNNGAVGFVIAILYPVNKSPPEMPDAVIVSFENYKGPAWLPEKPKWVPVVPCEGHCESRCCTRTGLPLMAGYSIPIAKSQGMTVGKNKPSENMRVCLQPAKIMETLNLGISYTAFSRCEKEENWCLVEKLPLDRLTYINEHPHMQERHNEEKRLNELSDTTIEHYSKFLDSAQYIQLLRQFDQVCNDGISTSICSESQEACPCLSCTDHM